MYGLDGDSLARSLGGGEVGPVELPPARIRVTGIETRRRWIWLAAFAVLGATVILVIDNEPTAAGDVDKVWQAGAAEDPPTVPANGLLARDEVYAIQVDGLPSAGRSDAMVTLVAVTDYGCVGCERGRSMLQSLRNSYGDELRIVWKPHATGDEIPSAAGACAAALQGDHLRYDDAAWKMGIEKSRQRSTPIALPDRDGVTRIARELGLDLTRFASALRRCEVAVKTSTRELDAVGVSTPAYFVNGRMVDPWGTESIGTFQSLIDLELAKARRRIAAGSPADHYYRDWVLVVGQTTR